MSRPTFDELRAVCQPEEIMSRRNAEHWLARLLLRRVSLRVTAVLVRMPVTANQVTGVMIGVGLVAALPAAGTGLLTALVAWALVITYFLLDLCDGEVARWRRSGVTASVTGVYLDRVGHYLVEAALLSAYGFRAGDGELGGWTTLGVATGLLAVLVKAETDLVDVARARKGLPVASDDSAGLRSSALGSARRWLAGLRLHQVTGALESSSLLVFAAAYDAVAGGHDAVQALVVVFAVVAGTMVVLHLVSILGSRRLR